MNMPAILGRAPKDAALVCNGDLHSCSSVALWHPDSRLPKGGTFRNAITDWLNEQRQEALQWERTLTKGRRRIRIENGDLVQGIADPFAEMISCLPTIQEANAVNIIKEATLPGDKLVLIRGTPRHDSAEGGSVEAIGEALGVPPVIGNERSQYEAWLLVNGVRIHITHHIGVSRSPVSETTALTSTLAMMNSQCARWKRPAPDIMVRAHRHCYDWIHVAGAGQGQAVFTTPAWAAKGEYAMKVSPNTIAHVGLVVILIDGDGHWEVRPHWTAIEANEEMTL